MIVRHLLAIFVLIGSTQMQGAAPEISNLPASVDIIESKADSTTDILFTLTASDPDNDIFTCTVQSTTPPVSDFLITDDSGTFNFYLNKNPPFDFDANAVYTVTVVCTYSNSETGTGDITVNLTPNPSPDISGLPAGVSVSETSALGFKVYDVTVTDTDPFTCVIDAQSPTADTFSISNPTRNKTSDFFQK